MNSKLILVIVCLALLYFPKFVRSQEFTPRTDEKTVKEYFWNSSAPKSNLTVIPEKWKNESAVYLTKSIEHRIFRTYSQFTSIFLNHIVIKLQDKAAVEKFSIFYADVYKEAFQLYYRHKVFYSFKIVKPDGTEKEINTKEEIITEEGSNSKREKIAIPGLEVGDILDFYWYSYDYSRRKEVHYGLLFYPIVSYVQNIQDDYPIADFNLTIKTDKSYRVELASYNGAKEFTKKKTDDGKRYLFTLSAKDLDKIDDVIWSYPLRTNPMIKAVVSFEKNFQKKNLKVNSDYCISKLDRDKIKDKYESFFLTLKSANNEYDAFKRYLEKNKKDNLPDEKKVEELYYYFRHLFLNKHLIYDAFTNNQSRSQTDYLYACHIFWGLHKMKIPYELLVIVSKRYGTINDLLRITECNNFILKANGKQPMYMFKPDKHALFNTIPDLVEGTKAIKLSTKDGKLQNLKMEEVTLPKSSCNSNATMYKYSIKIDTDNPNIIPLKGNISAKGHNAEEYKESLLIPYDFVFKENDIYETKRWGDVADIKNQNQVEKLNQLRADYEKDRKDKLIETITNNITVKPENLDYKLVSAGNWVSDSIFSIDFSCTIEGLITKAGNNYILNIGKFIGEQVSVDEKSVNRKIDIYMNYPRSYSYIIEVEIPVGYKISGMEKLEFSTINETGGFECKPSFADNKFTIKIKKYYLHDFEPLKNWPLMLDFLKAANTFTEQKILITK